MNTWQEIREVRFTALADEDPCSPEARAWIADLTAWTVSEFLADGRYDADFHDRDPRPEHAEELEAYVRENAPWAEELTIHNYRGTGRFPGPGMVIMAVLDDLGLLDDYRRIKNGTQADAFVSFA